MFESEPEDRILDVSAGTGLLAQHLLEDGYRFSKLILNDISTGMLNLARERINGSPDIHLTTQPAGQLHFNSRFFDRVISLNSFHHYENQEKFVREAVRILKPGGRLYLLDWNRKGLFYPINSLIRVFTDETINTASAEEVEGLLKSYAFEIDSLKEWQYGFWKLFLVEARRMG